MKDIINNNQQFLNEINKASQSNNDNNKCNTCNMDADKNTTDITQTLEKKIKELKKNEKFSSIKFKTRFW